MPHRKQLFKPFWDMVHVGIPEIMAENEPEEMAGLIPTRGAARLFLGCYDEELIREAIGRYGIQERLDALGLGDYFMIIDAADPDRQELRVYPAGRRAPRSGTDGGGGGPDDFEPIAELILRESLLAPKEGVYPTPRPFSFLVIQWIRLQDPRAPFDPARLLPGQHRPGLGAGRKVMELLRALTRRRGLEGMVNRPEFVHNAILYSEAFSFLNPEPQGRLEAIKRLVRERSLRDVAWGVEKGLVVEDGLRTFFRWYQSEQVWPGCDELRDYFASARYRDEVRRVRETATYRLMDEGEAQ